MPLRNPRGSDNYCGINGEPTFRWNIGIIRQCKSGVPCGAHTAKGRSVTDSLNPRHGSRGAVQTFSQTNSMVNMQKTLLLLTTVLFVHLSVPLAQAAPKISVDFFYDQLADYGDWVEVGDYGYGWQPRDVDESWRPYSDGQWAYTEAGWTWLTEEPYGWAVYHYGRWAQFVGKGWVWIPGTEWAPAWVSWRSSPKYVGWAPLPPEASFQQTVGFSGWVDSYYDIGPSAYRFVEVRNFGAPRMRTVFVEPRENITIIRETTNITRITYSNSVVINEGPRYEEISRVSAQPVRRLRLDRRVEIDGDRTTFRGEQMRSRVDGDALRVFAPGFEARAATPPKRLAARIEKAEINRGWKDAGPATEVEKLRVKVRGEARAPKDLPPQPKFEKLAEQRVAPDAQESKEKAPLAAPGENPRSEKINERRSEKMNDRRSAEQPSTTPTAPAPVAPSAESRVGPAAAAPSAESRVAPAPVAPSAESRVAPAADAPPAESAKARKQGKKEEKATDAEASGEQPQAPATLEGKPQPPMPPPTGPAGQERKGKTPKQQQQVSPTPVEPMEPKKKDSQPRAERKSLTASPDRAEAQSERASPQSEPRRESSEQQKEEPRKPKSERPESAREVRPADEKSRPKVDRPNPSSAPSDAPQTAPSEEPKPKGGKGKAKEEKAPAEDAPKAQ
jgi:hypothetical protein